MASQEQGRAVGECLHSDRGLARLLSSPNCSTIQYLGRKERPRGRKMSLGTGWAHHPFCRSLSPSMGKAVVTRGRTLPAVADSWSLSLPGPSLPPSLSHALMADPWPASLGHWEHRKLVACGSPPV